MLKLIFILIIGTVIAFISRSNDTLVSVSFGPYVFPQAPLFYVIMAALVAGLAIAYVVHLINVFFTSFVLRGKEREIKKNKNEVIELTKRVHQLELENEKLKHNKDIEPEDANAL